MLPISSSHTARNIQYMQFVGLKNTKPDARILFPWFSSLGIFFFDGEDQPVCSLKACVRAGFNEEKK